MPSVKNDTTAAAGGSGTGKWARSAEAETAGTAGSAAPTQQEVQVKHA